MNDEDISSWPNFRMVIMAPLSAAAVALQFGYLNANPCRGEAKIEVLQVL